MVGIREREMNAEGLREVTARMKRRTERAGEEKDDRGTTREVDGRHIPTRPIRHLLTLRLNISRLRTDRSIRSQSALLSVTPPLRFADGDNDGNHHWQPPRGRLGIAVEKRPRRRIGERLPRL